MKRVLGIGLIIILMSASFTFAAPTYEVEDMASDDVCDVVMFNYYLGYTIGAKYQSEKCVEVMGFTASLVVQNIKDMEDEALRFKAIENVKQNQKALEKSLLAGCEKSRTLADLDIKSFMAEQGDTVCQKLMKQ